MADDRLISADSHVSEPTDLWVERVDRRYRDRAPRLVENPRDPNGAYFFYEGYPPHPIGIGLAAGKSPEELAQFLTRGFPELQVVSAENNCGWLPYYLQRMDRTFERGRYAAGFKIALKPSEYFRRQLHCTYIDDYVGVANRHFIGVDRMMWSSDYPHQASSWPHSQEVVARDFKDASPDDRLRITRGNAARLYGFEL